MERVEDLYLAPVTLRQANDFISKHHKNNQPVPRDKFSIGCAADGRLMGVIVVGYPRDPAMNDGQTLAVRRICTIAGHAAYGMLYKAAARAAKAMGYWRIIAFLPVNEPGSALRAAGWRCAGTVEIKNGDASKKVRYEQWLAVRRRQLEGSEL